MTVLPPLTHALLIAALLLNWAHVNCVRDEGCDSGWEVGKVPVWLLLLRLWLLPVRRGHGGHWVFVAGSSAGADVPAGWGCCGLGLRGLVGIGGDKTSLFLSRVMGTAR